VFVNCVGQGGYTLIQGLGRPDITGKYHLAELPVFALMLWYLLPRYGIMGAAMAWSIRTVGDTVLLLGTCPRLLAQTRATIARMSVWLTAASVVLVASMLVHGTASRVAVVLVAVFAWLALVWRYLLTAQERELPIAKMLTGVLRPEQA
jgi:low temperature requirement protein LtrA